MSTIAWLACSADTVSVYVRQRLQLETPDAMRGRAAAVNAVFIGASNELCEFELGAGRGIAVCGCVGGVGTMAVAALWARWFRLA